MSTTIRRRGWRKEQPDVRFVLRVPPDVFAALGELAEQDKRSINNQINVILSDYLEQAQPPRTHAAHPLRQPA